MSIRRWLTLGLTAALLLTLTPTLAISADTAAAQEETAVRDRKGISHTYPIEYKDWTHGFFGGNGEMGTIVFGNPLNDTTVFNHRLFNLIGTFSQPERTFRDMSATKVEKNGAGQWVVSTASTAVPVLDRIRQACLEEDWETANRLANLTNWVDGGEGDKHPGYKMNFNIPAGGAVREYVRETDYRTGVTSVNWSDDRGDWTRDTFVSRQDNVIVQYLPAPSGGKLDVDITMGTDPGMNFPSGMTFTPTYTADWLKYQVKYRNSSWTNGAGYEGVTRVIAVGGTKTAAADKLEVRGADSVLLLTRIDKYYSGAEWESKKNDLQTALSAISTDYATLLAGNIATHGEMYDRVTLDLNASAEDRAKSNEDLLQEQQAGYETGATAEQKAISSKPNLALYERLFDAGRYHYLCSSGDMAPPDLLGIWAGDCNVGWGGYYHLDANLNLQISGAIIGNLAETMEGYWNINEQWVEGFKLNAQSLLGMNGIVGGGNTPNGDGRISRITDMFYPYQYVTGEVAWLLQPFWEYYQTSGDVAFLRDRMYPILKEMGLFYEDFLEEKDENGKYIFAGSISPENQPSGLGWSLVNNTAFDISSARFGLSALVEVCDILNVEQGAGGKKAVWQELLDNLPPLLFNDDGALSEWAWPSLANRKDYGHRHSSGLLGVWPYKEITPEKTPDYFDGAQIFINKKSKTEAAGHGNLMVGNIAANLKMPEIVNERLLWLASRKYYHTGLMTSHDPNYATFCTDVANSLPTIFMEMAMGTDTTLDGRAQLELLQAVPETLGKGSITGLKGRNQLTLNEITWDLEKRTVHCVVTSAVDQTVELVQRRGIQTITTTAKVTNSALGKIARNVELKAGVATVIDIKMEATPRYENVALGKPATASSSDDPGRTAGYAVDGDSISRWASSSQDANWIMVDLQETTKIGKLRLLWEAAYAKSYIIEGSLEGQTWFTIYDKTDSKGGLEEILLPDVVETRYVRMTGRERVEIGGEKYGYSLYEFEIYRLLDDGEDDPEGPEKWGDVSLDGKVDSTDARMILQHEVSLIELLGVAYYNGDVNDDYVLDSTDARLILQFEVKLIDHFPVEEQAG